VRGAGERNARQPNDLPLRMLAGATFCVVLSLALRERTVAVAFGLAAVAALVVQVLSRRGLSASIKRP
jgi:hypothetical protein